MDEVERPVVAWVGGLLALWQPLHEMDLALVLACLRAFPWPPTASEGHVPALVAGVPQCCVVVLQHNLSEDTVSALSIFLADELPPLVHADVEAGLSSLDAHAAPKCVCFHDEFSVHISIVGHGVDLLVGQDLHMLAAGPAVQLVDPDQPAAHAVRHFALLAYMLREIRRGLIGYLSIVAKCE